MIRIESAKESSLASVLRKSRSSIVCTPFFTREGIEMVSGHLEKSRAVDLVLRADLNDWVTGYADLECLSGLITKLHLRDVGVTIRMIRGLHAKVYASYDNNRAYFGSANLTEAAFSSNSEIMTYADNGHARQLFEVVKNMVNSFDPIPPTKFQDFVDISKDVVKKIRAKGTPRIVMDNDFLAAEELYNKELFPLHHRIRHTSGTHVRSVVPDESQKYRSLGAPWPDLGEFIRYCEKSRVPDARVIVNRFYGLSNLQGHIKHMFYGCLFFFYENHGMIKHIPQDLLRRDRVYWSSEAWVMKWKKHLLKHANESFGNISFSYPTLITYLPEGLGGTQTSGGASSGNFKKVVFLLAAMLREKKVA